MENAIKNTNIYLVSKDDINKKTYMFNFVINLSLLAQLTGNYIDTDSINDNFAFRELIETAHCDEVGTGLNSLVIYGSTLESDNDSLLKNRIRQILINLGVSDDIDIIYMLTEKLYRKTINLNYYVKNTLYAEFLHMKNFTKDIFKDDPAVEKVVQMMGEAINNASEIKTKNEKLLASIKAGLEMHLKEFFNKENIPSNSEKAKLIQSYRDRIFDIIQSQYQDKKNIDELADNLNKMHVALNEHSKAYLKKEAIIKDDDEKPTDPIDAVIEEIEAVTKERHGKNSIKGKIICVSGSTRLKPQIVAMKDALEKYGAIVLSPEYYSHYEGVTLNEKQLDVLEKVHMEKLKRCDLHVVIAELEPYTINVHQFTVGESVRKEMNYTIDHYTGTLIVPISPTVIDQSDIEKIANNNAGLIADGGYENATFTTQSFSNFIVLNTEGIIK